MGKYHFILLSIEVKITFMYGFDEFASTITSSPVVRRPIFPLIPDATWSATGFDPGGHSIKNVSLKIGFGG
jgi:hypothetical protein